MEVPPYSSRSHSVASFGSSSSSRMSSISFSSSSSSSSNGIDGSSAADHLPTYSSSSTENSPSRSEETVVGVAGRAIEHLRYIDRAMKTVRMGWKDVEERFHLLASTGQDEIAALDPTNFGCCIGEITMFKEAYRKPTS